MAHSKAPVSILTKNIQMRDKCLNPKGKELGDLRLIFMERGPEAMKKLSQAFDAPLDGLLKVLSELPFVALDSARPKESIQEGLMALLKKSGARNIDTQYAEALKSARGAFFDLVTGDVREVSDK